MSEKISLALDTAEKNYIYNRSLKLENNKIVLADHIIALNALFESFVHYGVAVSQISDVMCELKEESALFECLIEPHLKVVDNIEMITKQYTLMYVQYIAKIAQGARSQEAVEKLFA